MKNIFRKLVFIGLPILFIGGPAFAKQKKYKGGGKVSQTYNMTRTTGLRAADGCDPATSQTDLDVNNVRATVLNGGDMWWDLVDVAKYEVPKSEPGQPKKTALFASGVWFGGVDAGGQLKTAGQTYRQFPNAQPGANDFWPGPLDTATASISREECKTWDKHFTVYQSDIVKYQAGEQPENYNSASILGWPGNGDMSKGQSQFLAPYIDADGNGAYNPSSTGGSGVDYPTLDPSVPQAVPDQMIWWVFNDKGNLHQKYAGAEPIGLEIHALAFAFKTANEVNNMTFYKYRIFNRAFSPLFDTYFGIFTDPDLGDAADDYVGCNMELKDSDGPLGPAPTKPRNIGYVYNADNDDGTAQGYGVAPPAVGIDFFKGPLDEFGNELPMAHFFYFTNAAPDQVSDPDDAVEMYRYLRGFWADGTRMTYGGTGYSPGGTDYADYAFPGTTDPQGRANWSEMTESNTPGDRRTVQSAGPFRLEAGAVNEIILGVVYGRAGNGGNNLTSIDVMMDADNKAQILFDNKFKLANGPAPVTVNAVPLDGKIILALEVTHRTERYDEMELDNESLSSFRYTFQGYKIYQLRNSSVNDLSNPTDAVEIFQVDVRDSVTKIINQVYDASTSHFNAYVMVEGKNQGIRHIFDVTKDAFARTADNAIVNQKPYYFTVIPYGFSGASPYTKYLPSRITNVYTVVPRKPLLNGTTSLNIASGVPMTKYDGAGNGGNVLDITPESEAEIVANVKASNVKYQLGKGPVTIRVYDPKLIPDMNFKVVFRADMKGYQLLNADNGNLLMESDTTYDMNNQLTDNEQIAEIRTLDGLGRITKRVPLGFTIKANNTVKSPGVSSKDNNGFLEATLTYTDPNKGWLAGISNEETAWIDGGIALDTAGVYQNVLSGTWAPYRVIKAVANNTPCFDAISRTQSVLQNTASVDIVFTSDSSKWSHCVVVESNNGAEIDPVNGQKRLNLRSDDIGYGVGRGRFPGYAINMETGERLNIFFAEASALVNDNGNDMLFNPSTSRSANRTGGRHFIYVHSTRYDSCKTIYNALVGPGNDIKNPPLAGKRAMYAAVQWVSVPATVPHTTFLDTDARVRLRVAKPYVNYVGDGSNAGAPSYTFNTKEVIGRRYGSESENQANALDAIRIVPNPYYANSGYEASANDFKVRFSNLPVNATISIFTAGGTLVRRLTKSDADISYLDWDLQNSNRIPIASGMYIIHVKADGWGEKTLKWFAVMRPVSFDNF